MLGESELLLPASWQKIEVISFSQENADELDSMDRVQHSWWLSEVNI